MRFHLKYFAYIFVLYWLIVSLKFILKVRLRSNGTLIIVCTPTSKTMTRLADLTRLSQTLMHIPNLHWIVVEDGRKINEAVENVLKRSMIDFSYIATPTPPEFERRKAGWAQRNFGLQYIRQEYVWFTGNAVVYFADDDNTYDIRLFKDYISQIKTVGMWAVGLVGRALVETPIIKKGKIEGFHVVFNPSRTFATDMAGFAVNLKLILNSKAKFHHLCEVYNSEDCFLRQLNITLNDVQPFENDPKEVLVWHTKTNHSGAEGSDFGFTVFA